MPTPPELFVDKYDLMDNMHLLDEQEIQSLSESYTDPEISRVATEELISRYATEEGTGTPSGTNKRSVDKELSELADNLKRLVESGYVQKTDETIEFIQQHSSE